MTQRVIRRIVTLLLGVAIVFGMASSASTAHQSTLLVADNPGGGNGSGGGG